MIDIVVDFSKREGYLLQPTKSVVLPVKSVQLVKLSIVGLPDLLFYTIFDFKIASLLLLCSFSLQSRRIWNQHGRPNDQLKKEKNNAQNKLRKQLRNLRTL
jgi:hypothetical protein